MKSIKNNTKLSINISKEDTDNNFLYCWNLFGNRPNKVKIFNTYSKKHFNDVIDVYTIEKSFSSEVFPAEDINIINDNYFIKVSDTVYLSYILLDRESELSFIHEITFYFKSYQDDLKSVNQIINDLEQCQIDFEDIEETGSKLNTIYISPNGLEIEQIDSYIEENIDIFYNEDTLKAINKLSKAINKSNKGLSILYGERGTGKTSIINYISSKIDRIIIYIPNSLLEATINNSEFRTFLQKFSRPIIVIDDAEMIFNELFTKSNIYVNNLLQLVEGLLSDIIQVNIIVIFNVDNEDEIDHSLLECNSLIDIIKFEYLDKKQATELSKYLNHTKKYKNNTKLIDIINKTDTRVHKKIGFD